MNFRVLALLLSVSFFFIQCATQKNSSNAWQKSIEEDYYTIWSTGAAPAGTGANFFVKFNKTGDVKVQSFVVNEEDVEFELRQTETETLIIGRKYTSPDFEKQNQEMPEFYRQEKYNGMLSFSVEGKTVSVSISSFERREPDQRNL